MNTSHKVAGEIAEALILARLIQLGYAVSMPFGNNQRYDLIVDDGNSLRRAQCKTGRMRNGAVTFAVCSKNGFTGVRKAYHGEIEEFLVYCPDNDGYYRVPAAGVGSNQVSLRVSPAKNNQDYGVRLASDYVLS